MLHITTYETPAGFINIKYSSDCIHNASFVESKSCMTIHNSFGEKIQRELKLYFNDPKFMFKLNLNYQGTTYQKRVWDALMRIPSGSTVSYGELACQLNTSPRAIGQACKRNQIVLFIPCHRVVGKNSQGGYMGTPSAVAFKSALLNHEH